jgi:hypothetical protein
MAAALAKIVGIEQGVRSSTEQWWKLVRDALTKEQLLFGLHKTYQPEEGQLPQPTEDKRVQINVEQLLTEAREKLGRYFDITATKDWGNTGDGGARADVILDGQVCLADVPATFLLYLHKQLTEFAADLKKIPVQSAAENWQPSTEPGIWKTPDITSHSTRRIDHYEVLGLTKEHPGQLVNKTEDIVSGTWTTVKLTSAPTMASMSGILDRIGQLRDAVQSAIYDANTIQVDDVKVSGQVFGWIFDGTMGARS